MDIKVGCCGFCVSRKEYFELFDIVEIQKTFYRIVDEKTLIRWKNEAPKNFYFSIKAFQGITHPTTSPTWNKSNFEKHEINKLKEKVGYLRPTKEVFNFWDISLKEAKTLNAKAIVIQLPRSFRPTKENIQNAINFLSSIDESKIAIAIELRGWDENNKRRLIVKNNITIVGDFLNEIPIPNKEILYLRLHGKMDNGKINYKHKYTEQELLEIAKKIKHNALVLFNNIYMKEDTLRFKKLIQRAYQK